MRVFRWFVAASLFLVPGLGSAQQIQIQILPGQPAQVGGFAPTNALGAMLLAPAAVEKLKLTAEQKEKYGKIEAEYKDKQKTANDKLKEAATGQERAKVAEIYKNAHAEREKLRGDYLAKVEALLTDDQKKAFEEVKKAQPAANAWVRAGGILPMPQVGAPVLPPAAQARLKLTDEQKKKIEEIQKEMEAKIVSVLTEEQKKHYDEMKQQANPQRPAIQLRPGANPQPNPSTKKLEEVRKNLENGRKELEK